jgi:hypothetical protein
MKDVNLKITKADKTLLDNLIRILGRIKIELEGAEILLASDSMRWLVRLQKQIEEEAKKPDVQIKNTEPIKAEVSEITTSPMKKGKK